MINISEEYPLKRKEKYQFFVLISKMAFAERNAVKM